MAAAGTTRTNRRVVYETLRRKVLTLELPPGHRAVGERAGRGARREPYARAGEPHPARRRGPGPGVPAGGHVRLARRPGPGPRRPVPPRGRRARGARRRPGRARPERRGRAAGQPRPAAGTGDRPRGVLRPRRGVPPRPAAAQRARAGLVDGRVRQGPPRPGPAARASRRPRRASFADQHVEIFQAVVDGDLPRARDTMRTHLRAVFEDVERIRQRSPELFARTTARCRCGATSSSGSECRVAAGSSGCCFEE